MLERYYRELLSFLSRAVKDRDTAADLAQESYARVLAAQQAGRPVRDPRALLYRTARNLVIDQHRRDEVREADDIDALGEPSQPSAASHWQPEEACASSEALQAYIRTIEALPPRCREVFYLYAFDELPNKAIAERLGLSLSMVNQYISRAKLACAACREALEKNG